MTKVTPEEDTLYYYWGQLPVLYLGTVWLPDSESCWPHSHSWSPASPGQGGGLAEGCYMLVIGGILGDHSGSLLHFQQTWGKNYFLHNQGF